MSIATTKAAIDKLVKLYEPLHNAQEMLTDLEAAEQRLREAALLTAGEAEAVKLLKTERDRLTDAVKKLRDTHDATMQLTADKAAEAAARVKQEISDIERAADETVKQLDATYSERLVRIEALDGQIASKTDELAKVENAINKQRDALRKVAESI
jgi:hypothetical protein